jgi:multiple sugar transport system substrate-binding protein/putative aldouronate transport system substrate-binding protein
MGALTTLEYLEKHNGYAVAAGNGYIPEAAPAEIDTIRNQCKAIIIENSWKMVFAKDEAEFNALLKEMQDTVISLGYNDVLEFDKKIAENIRKAREEAIANASK